MLIPTAENVWTVDHEVRLPPGIPLPARMTLLRLTDGRLVIISPVPISDELGSAIDRLGPVGFLVAPNLLHHLYLRAAAARWPQARLLAPRGLAEKLGGLPEHGILDDGAPADWAGQLEILTVQGFKGLGETVFFHRQSRTLVLTDLLFNIVSPRVWTLGLVLRIMGTHGRLARSRMLTSMIKDPAAAESSYRQLLQWDFDRLIVAHGEVRESGARAAVAEALGVAAA